MEGEEICDDGNADNTDECTTLCEPPHCDDGLWSGLETDVDCGGPECDACVLGDGCSETTDCAAGLLCDLKTQSCRSPASCLEHQHLDGTAPSDWYEIDPLGDGGTLEVFCEMDENGGGWTRVLDQTFDVVDSEWNPWWTTTCGSFDVLGPLGMGQSATRDVELLGVPHTDAWLRVRYVTMGYWDLGDSTYFYLDGIQVFEDPYGSGALLGDLCGAENYFNEIWGSNGHATNTVGITIGTSLNDADESLGVDVVSLYIR